MKRAIKVSIVIPSKNEGEGIEKIIKSVKKYVDEIIVVDGHSNDKTKEKTLKNKAIYLLDNNLGRGDAVKIGLSKAKGDVVVLFDADGSHNESEIPQFINTLIKNKADLVIGSRRKGGSSDMQMNINGLIRSVGSDLLVMMLNHRFNTNYTDIIYSFRCLRKNSLKGIKLKSDDFSIEHEMVVEFLKKKKQVIEIPSRENARGWGESKLRTFTGLKMAFHLFKILYF